LSISGVKNRIYTKTGLLGDDFRYTQCTKWEAQRINFEKLFEYINNEVNLNVDARFGTLQDYFDSVRS
jgi:alpha-mannosidase II